MRRLFLLLLQVLSFWANESPDLTVDLSVITSVLLEVYVSDFFLSLLFCLDLFGLVLKLSQSYVFNIWIASSIIVGYRSCLKECFCFKADNRNPYHSLRTCSSNRYAIIFAEAYFLSVSIDVCPTTNYLMEYDFPSKFQDCNVSYIPERSLVATHLYSFFSSITDEKFYGIYDSSPFI